MDRRTFMKSLPVIGGLAMFLRPRKNIGVPRLSANAYCGPIPRAYFRSVTGNGGSSPTITVHKSGGITGIGRYTEVPFAAMDLAEHNMMFPKEAVRKEFEVSESAKT